MLYRFFIKNKKGNITVILIGLISVMILMAIALTKRITSHTQLLTLGDYTQISRYFLESYINSVMQQVRAAVNDPTSNLSRKICESIDDLSTEIKIERSDFTYKLSDEIKFLETAYGTNNKIIRNEPKIKLTDKTHPINYPKGVLAPADKKGVEKVGYLEISCSCEFNKRKYNLCVQYPFSVVKDFMLYVDRINCDQSFNGGSRDFDRINVVKIDGDKYASNQDGRKNNNFRSGPIKPFVLMQPLNQNKFDKPEISGKVYLGAPFNKSGVYDQPVYLNLTGGKVDDSISETFLISAKDIGLSNEVASDNAALDERTFLYYADRNGSIQELKLPCWPVKLENEARANMSVMGFCDKTSEALNDVAAYSMKDFLCPEPTSGNYDMSHFQNVKVGLNNLESSLEYATSLKLFGLNTSSADDTYITQREIYGNVFARYMLLTFWNPNGTVNGLPLNYDEGKNFTDIPEIELISFGDDVRTRKFKVLQDGKYYPPDVDYKFFMSKIVSGLAWEQYHDKNWAKNFFMPMNINYEISSQDMSSAHVLYNEDRFKAADGFRIKKENMKFNKLGEEWFKVSPLDTPKEDLSPIEKRIGRIFKTKEKFKDAVGYPDKFIVNGVVYVDDDLDLDDDLILDDKNCSGGIVLVKGKINIKNIYRGDKDKVKANNFKLEDHSAEDRFNEWNNNNAPASDKKYYVAPDKILTFVSLLGEPITINGNVVLGVQLINFGKPNEEPSSSFGNDEQIKWSVTEPIIFYGSIACNRLNLLDKIHKFGEISRYYDTILDAPFFIYPPVMATDTPPVAVQIMENMRCYRLNVGEEPSSQNGAPR